jgi:acetyl esterase
VLDKLTELGAQPIAALSVEETRAQPTPADAVAALIEEQGVETDPALTAIRTTDMMIPGAAGDIPARIYAPEGAGPFPVIVYWHGGGWAIAGIETYDASARQLAAGAQALVVSLSYRQAPENAEAQPLSRSAMKWFVEQVFDDPAQAADPRLDLVERDDLTDCRRRPFSMPRSTRRRPRVKPMPPNLKRPA